MSDAASAQNNNRPNILWLSCEDMSPHLGCYGHQQAATPNLDAFAEEGARYTHAFSIAGVCAPSRSCIITGMYPTTLGTLHMRCSNPPPDYVKCFPEYLRDAGYYCTNNSKTDYNFPPPASAWDESSKKAHWRNRKEPSQPFFSVFNFVGTHESKIGTLPPDLDEGLRSLLPSPPHDPDEVPLPPYYPDTPVIRKHWAHYFDLVTAMDTWAGRMLAELEEDGLAENTIVFYFSDHGVGLPRAKRWMYDCGIQIPLMVRWPGEISGGLVKDDLVSFVDFAPTVLALAGVEPPDHMQGQILLGDDAAPPRKYIHAARDRMDERYDIIRAIRDKRFKYIRNYEPYRPYDQYLSYPESFPVMQEMRFMERTGQLQGSETLFFQDRKPLEELYDMSVDPHETQNLAYLEGYDDTLRRVRRAMNDWVLETHDLGLVPEMLLDQWRPPNAPPATDSPEYAMPVGGAAHQKIAGREAIAWLLDLRGSNPFVRLQGIKMLGNGGQPYEPILRAVLTDPEPAVAHWAAIGLGHLDEITQESLAALEAALNHESVAVYLAAARALLLHGPHDEALKTAIAGLEHENKHARVHAVETLEMVDVEIPGVREALERAVKDDYDYVKRIADHALKKAS